MHELTQSHASYKFLPKFTRNGGRKTREKLRDIHFSKNPVAAPERLKSFYHRATYLFYCKLN